MIELGYTEKNNEDLSCKDELLTVLKGFKNNKALGVDKVVNELLIYGGF